MPSNSTIWSLGRSVRVYWDYSSEKHWSICNGEIGEYWCWDGQGQGWPMRPTVWMVGSVRSSERIDKSKATTARMSKRNRPAHQVHKQIPFILSRKQVNFWNINITLLAKICCCFQHSHFLIIQAPSHTSKNLICLARSINFNKRHRALSYNVVQSDLSCRDFCIDFRLRKTKLMQLMENKKIIRRVHFGRTYWWSITSTVSVIHVA